MPEILAEVEESIDITAAVAATPGSLTDDYNDMQNRPSINGVTLEGDKTTSDLHIDHVPLADNLVATTGITSSSPYLFRRSPQKVSAELHRLTGCTVAWNQQIITTEKSGSVTPSGSTYYSAKYLTGSATIGHVYFMSAMFAYSGSGADVNPFLQAGTSKRVTTTLSSTKKLVQMLQKVTGQTTLGLGITTGSGGRTLTSADAWSYDDAVAIDLTALFGSTVADAIATMETTTAGSGVAFFRSMFPSAYYPYSAPTLASVQTSARVARGFNQWDEEWEVGAYDMVGAKMADSIRIRAKNPFPILPNTQYRSTVSGYYYEYGADGTFLSRAEHFANTTFTTGSGSCFMTFHTYSSYGTVYLHNITIGFSVPEMNGVYVPYEAKTYPIDDVVLRGIPKLTNGVLSYDGDIYLPTGEVTRRYGIVDLGTLTWTKDSGYNYFRATITGGKNPASGGTADAICSNYVTYTGNLSGFNTADKMCYVCASNISSSPQVAVIDSAHVSDTTAQFKTAMSGVYLVYPLQTPTTESADPYTEVQLAGTTEQFVTENYIPVGNETFYPTDLTNVVQNLAPLPTTAGTYKLQVTVSGGVPSYSWVAG